MLKVLSLFSGIGAFEKALDRCGVPYELANYCEIDKYAAKAYSLIHDAWQELNLGDITKVDTSKLGKVDMITYGFPCQDISNAGKQKGFADENGERTRSGLFFEALRIIEDTKPKFAICENVKALTGKKFKKEFGIVLESLESAGYNNYWQVLNAKDYGIPQNRERVFIISIRKDIDQGYDFPQPIRLELRLKDILEDKVDEKFYLSNVQMEKILDWKAHQKPFERVLGNKSISPTLTARGAGEYHSGMILYSPDNKNSCNMSNEVQIFIDKSNNNPQAIEIANCITAREDRGVSNRRKEGTAVVEVEPMCAASRGRNPNNPSDRTAGAYTEQRLEINTKGTSNTITTVLEDNYIIEPRLKTTQNLRIRKLTPKECWRLMGFDDADIDVCIANGISNSQLYKMAGNSIVVDVLEAIFGKLGEVYGEFNAGENI